MHIQLYVCLYVDGFMYVCSIDSFIRSPYPEFLRSFVVVIDVIRPKKNVIVVKYQGFHFACYENKENLSRIIFKRVIASSSHDGVSSDVEEKQLY